ncbi:MAG: tetratricopeptide repeat protein [Acidobacteria bacterium]|nr:tetratricopeptide repeat protein [Acidobacteriota bacterium]
MPIQTLAGMVVCLALAFALPAPAQTSDDLARARDLYKEKKFQEAEDLLREALSGEPENAEAGYWLGLCLLELKEYEEAEKALRNAEENRPEEPRAMPRVDMIRIGLARSYMERDRLNEAQAALDAAVKIKADNPDAYYYRGMLDARRKDYAASARSMDKAIELDPRNAYAHYYAGLAYNQIKRPDLVVQRLQMFLKLAPDAPEAVKVQSLLRSIR